MVVATDRNPRSQWESSRKGETSPLFWTRAFVVSLGASSRRGSRGQKSSDMRMPPKFLTFLTLWSSHDRLVAESVWGCELPRGVTAAWSRSKNRADGLDFL